MSIPEHSKAHNLAEFYIEFLIKWGAVDDMARHYGLTVDECLEFIKVGGFIHNNRAIIRRFDEALHVHNA